VATGRTRSIPGICFTVPRGWPGDRAIYRPQRLPAGRTRRPGGLMQPNFGLGWRSAIFRPQWPLVVL
jgi:hypothetical protein